MMGHWWKAKKSSGDSVSSGFQQRARKAFTIVEVSLFLAISSLLFIGIVASIGTRVNDQRYNDSVNDFAEFLRNVYNEVGNTENLAQGSGESFRYGCTLSADRNERNLDGSPGRSDCALYGKMILFNWDNNGTPYVYDLVGNAVDFYHPLGDDNASALDSLKSVGAGILALRCTNDRHNSCTAGYAGSEQKYITPWQHRIEHPERRNNNLASYTIIIARAPSDNAIHTFVLDASRDVGYVGARGEINNSNIQSLNSATLNCSSSCNTNSVYSRIGSGSSRNALSMTSDDNSGKYSELSDGANAVDFCIDESTNSNSNNRRRNVRLNAGATSADAVEIVQMDSGDNRCNN